MPEGNSFSLVNANGLAKPIDTFIKKVSGAVGLLYEPHHIKRIARANVDAAIIKAQGEVELTEIQSRAINRLIQEESNRQQNMEQIMEEAISMVSDNSDPSGMDDDWITNFFDKAKIVSDSEMQSLWARVLSGETNAPGSYSKRTINRLADIDKNDAKLFTDLCGFGCSIAGFTPIVFDSTDEIYNRYGLNFESLNHLESIGLIKFGGVTGFALRSIPKRFGIDYYGTRLILERPDDADNHEFDVGAVMLTKTGSELAPICGSKPVEGFFDYMKEKWKKYAPKS